MFLTDDNAADDKTGGTTAMSPGSWYMSMKHAGKFGNKKNWEGKMNCKKKKKKDAKKIENKKITAFLLSAAVGIGAFSMQMTGTALSLGTERMDSSVMTVQAAAKPSASSLASAVKKAYGENYWPNYKLDKNEIKDKYGVSSSWYSSAYAEVPMISAQVDQLVIFKAKNTASKKKILSAVKKYQKNLKNDTMQYPMNRLKIQGSKVYSNGKYVCFFMLGGNADKSLEETGSEEEIIKAYQQMNKKAVNTVKNKLK